MEAKAAHRRLQQKCKSDQQVTFSTGLKYGATFQVEPPPARLHSMLFDWAQSCLVVVVFTFFCAGPLHAHQGTDHVAEDENAAQLAQGYLPFEVAAETINVPSQEDFDVLGSWGPVINWPHIPVSAANLADGRVLTWASNLPDDFPEGVEYTYATVWDPATNAFTDVPHSNHDMFCAHQVVLEDGRVFVNGGRNHVPTTSVFDSATNTWTVVDEMNKGRWYPTSVSLSDGGVLTAIGIRWALSGSLASGAGLGVADRY